MNYHNKLSAAVTYPYTIPGSRWFLTLVIVLSVAIVVALLFGGAFMSAQEIGALWLCSGICGALGAREHHRCKFGGGW